MLKISKRGYNTYDIWTVNNGNNTRIEAPEIKVRMKEKI
jgi:hypothetical protein